MEKSSNVRQHYRWSLKTSFLISLGILAVVIPTVLLYVHQSIWTELEIVTGIMTALMWAYFAVVLYWGVRFDLQQRVIIDWPSGRPSDFLDVASYLPGDGIFTKVGAEAGIIAMIIGFIIDLLIAILLCLVLSWLLWIGVNVIIAIFILLYWFHHRSLRYLVSKVRYCCGNWSMSLYYGFLAAIRYGFWFYAIFFAAHLISNLTMK